MLLQIEYEPQVEKRSLFYLKWRLEDWRNCHCHLIFFN